MMTRTSRPLHTVGPVLTLVVVFTFAITLLAPSAQSHSGLITKRWIRDTQVEFDFTASMSGMPANSRERIEQAAAQWNGLNGNVALISRGNVPNYTPDECPATFQQDAMHFLPIDGPSKTLGVANTCFNTSTGELHSMQITFDTAEAWYAGTATPPSGQIDVWAVATHELGHTLGIGHFDAADAVCSTQSRRETMCPFYSPAMRTPGDHDIHGFAAVYGGGPPAQQQETQQPESPAAQTTAAPENQPPTALNVRQRVRRAQPFTSTLSATDPEGKTVIFDLISQNFNAAKHSFNFEESGEFSIVPQAPPATELKFRYQACDDQGKCSPVRTVTLRVTR